MKLPFSRKKPARGDFRNQAFSLRRSSPKVIKRRKAAKFREATVSFSQKRSLIYSLAGITLLVLLILGVAYFLGSDTFALKHIVLIGNSSIDDAVLQTKLQPYNGNNMFLLRSGAMEATLYEADLYFQEVQVKKLLPDTVQIFLRERQPNSTIINFAGSFLVDEQGTVVETIASGKINLSEEDIDIIKGFGNPNADYVKERLMPSRPAEDPDATPTPPPDSTNEVLDFSLIPVERKLATLEQIRSELLGKASDQLNNYSQETSKSRYAGLPRVFVYENVSYAVNDSVDLERLELSNEVRAYFSNNQAYIIERVTWEGPYLVNFSFASGKNLRFGTQRSVSEQLEDFTIVTDRLRLQGRDFAEMDLSSRKVSVK